MPAASGDFARWALAAQAAYSQFDLWDLDREALLERGKGDFVTAEVMRFLGEVSDPFVSNLQGFRLLDHQADQTSGFSATVFLDRTTNKNVLAIRGTAGLIDLLEDVNRIGIQGYAGDQLVSLYRYYKQLTTPSGQRVQYSNSEILMLQLIRLGIPANGLTAVLNPLRGAALRDELAADFGIPPNAVGFTSVLPAGAPLIITGHSLGGHLALLFGRFFPEVTEHVYTYNAPGISPIGEAALRAMGIPPLAPSLVTNVASEMGGEAISRIWSKPGENIGIATEPGTLLHQHSIVPLTDMLALYSAFSTLSPGSPPDASTTSGIILAASPRADEGMEILVDELSELLGTGSVITPIARTGADRDARDAYFRNLYRALDGREPGRDYQIVSLADKSAAELAELAASEVGVRYALAKLQPFAAKNADYSSFTDSFSGEWLASRAEWLEAQSGGNLVDRPFGLSGSTENVIFRDVDTGLPYSKLDSVQASLALPIAGLADRSRIQQFLFGVNYSRSVLFGSSSEANHLLGMVGGDRIFGGPAADTLEGKAGDDYLEGGGGDDRLVGDSGDDTLVGGAGSDRLEGGAGDDAYVYAESLDADTIQDTDGRIWVDGSLLTGGRGSNGSAYQSADGLYTYAFSGDLDLGGTLTVNGALRVENFRNGNLGIRLRTMDEPDDAPLPGPPGGVLLLGDADYDAAPPEGSGTGAERDEYGNPTPGMYAVPMPGKVDTYEEFPGTPGATHFVSGGGGDVMQDIHGGDDWLELGTGDDIGWGGTGSDLVEGGPGRDIVAGGRGNDVLYAGERATKSADLDDDGVAFLPGGGDLLSGGDGNDFIFGDAEANLIEGGSGEDQIYAGAGDDWIGADVSVLTAAEHYRTFSPIDVWAVGEFDFIVSDPYFGLPTFSLGPSPEYGTRREASINGQSISAYFQTDGSRDYVDAGSGNDTIYAGGGEDIVFGGSGDDYIVLGPGTDTVSGGAGRDVIFKTLPAPAGGDDVGGDGGGDGIGSGGGGGGDGPPPEGESVPGDGDSEFITSGLGDGGGDGIYGGDTTTGEAEGGAFIAGGSAEEAGDDIDGGDGDDEIVDMAGGGNRIDGGAGNDNLTSGAGSDLLLGGQGNDRVFSSGGDDVLLGGDGNDQVLFGGGGHAFLAGGAGDDLLVGDLQHSGGAVTFGWSPGDGNDRGLVLGGSGTLQIGALPGQVSVAHVTGVPAGELANEDRPEAQSEGFQFTFDGASDSFLFLEVPDYFDRANLQVRFADGTTWDDTYLRALAAPPGAPAEPVTFYGTVGEDVLYGSQDADRFASTGGNDWLVGGAGDDVYEYALGDGFDEIEDADGGQDALRFAAGIGTADVGAYAAGQDYILAVGEGGVRIRGGRTAEGAIERIEFANGASWTPADLSGRAELLPDNRAPDLPSTFGRVAVDPGNELQFAIAEGGVADPDRFDAVSLYAITADGERLPSWLNFDAASRTLSGTPSEGDAGVHEILFIAADTSGAASAGSLMIAVGPDLPPPEVPPAPSASPAIGSPAPAPEVTVPVLTDLPPQAGFEPAAAPAPLASPAPIPPSRDEPFAFDDAAPDRAEASLAFADSAEPSFREVQHRLDVLLQTGRSNLGERYAEAIREFEERRLEREEAPIPPPTEEEIEAWNAAMHSWHDRNPGFAETELGSNDGAWSLGWGLPVAQQSSLGELLTNSAAPGLANPGALARLQGAATAPALSEGFRQIRS